jgi:signal transduction histidine kinase
MHVERGMLIGAAALRWASWIWLAVLALANLHRLHDRPLAVAAVAVTGAVTVATSLPLAGDSYTKRALRPPLVIAEVAAALFILLADGWVQEGRVIGQTLSGSWPIPCILVAALAGGLFWGTATAVALGAARGAAVVISGWSPGEQGRAALSAVSTAFEWIAFGIACAVVVRLLRQARDQIAEITVRERVARDLHDGVLQTLTMIERRSPSDEVARLARDQERELRAYLFGDRQAPGRLAAALRDAASKLERYWPDTRVTVSLSDDAAGLEGPAVGVVTAAVAEALTNAAKHGRAATVVVFGDVDEHDGRLFVSVKDNGTGFDPAAVVPRVGMGESIRARVESSGGQVEFVSRPGDGAEVRMRMPLQNLAQRR